MGRINAITSYFLEFKWKVGKYPTAQNVKGNIIPAEDGIFDLPDPKLFKPSIDIFTIHDLSIS
jgi:hypothetical protein